MRKKKAKNAAHPPKIINSVETEIKESCAALVESVGNMLNNEVFLAELSKANNILIETYKRKGTIWIAGNGCSHCDAEYLAGILISTFDGFESTIIARALGSAALSSVINAVALPNHGLAAELTTYACPAKDCLIAMGTTGNIESVLNVANYARMMAMPVITFTGYPGSPLSSFGDAKMRTPVCGDTLQAARTQEMHRIIYHTLCRQLKQYAAANT